MMMALLDLPTPAWRSARNSCGMDSPPMPKAPILMKFRRWIPSQSRCCRPWMVSIVICPSVASDNNDTGVSQFSELEVNDGLSLPECP